MALAMTEGLPPGEVALHCDGGVASIGTFLLTYDRHGNVRRNTLCYLR